MPLATGTNNSERHRRGPQPAVDRRRQQRVSVVYAGTNASPAGQIVINEIMYAAGVANAQFVELYNNSTNTAFDLSGWQLAGSGYTFPNGSILGPTNYLVLAANRAAFAAAYGATNPVFDIFGGTLSAEWGDAHAEQRRATLAVAKVKYANQLPWPTNANGGGMSLQLIDPRQDNWRVGNWTAVAHQHAPHAAMDLCHRHRHGLQLHVLHLSAIRRRRLCGRPQTGRRQRAGSGREPLDQTAILNPVFRARGRFRPTWPIPSSAPRSSIPATPVCT